MNELPPVIRAFVAVPVPKSVRMELARVQAMVKPELREISWTRPEAMHLTLHFFGNIESVRVPEISETLTRATTSFTSFGLEARGVGHFGQRVIWAGIEGEVTQLQRLAGGICGTLRELGFESEKRQFNPHITIGRVKTRVRGLNAKLASWKEARFGAFSVDHVELIRSELSPHSSRYTALHTFALK